MRKKRFVRWGQYVPIILGRTPKNWSSYAKGEGDSSLAVDSPMKDWTKIIILRPLGDQKTTFQIGFRDVFNNIKISSAKRRVKDGSFGMRMGSKDCNFFIVSINGAVGLGIMGYAHINDEKYKNLALY
ncbi:MAG: hypothetical protein Q8P89_01640 [bacterium]|nr:hypothetical protein [bacterium]